MKCYTLTPSATLDPYITAHSKPGHLSTIKWEILVGSDGPNAKCERWPLPKVLDAESLDLNDFQMDVSEIALPKGTFLLLIKDQTPYGGYADVKFSHPTTAFSRGFCSHTYNGQSYGGNEYLVSMLPGDYVEVKSFTHPGCTPHRFFVYAGHQSLSIIGGSEFPKHPPLTFD